MSSSLLSDLIVALHVLWVATIIIPVPLIIIGYFLRWQWIRNFWLRVIHLTMMALVLTETILGISCPLTLWENKFRQMAGDEGYSQTFIGYYLHKLLYYDFPPWVFGAAYALFVIIIIALMILIPPFKKSHKVRL